MTSISFTTVDEVGSLFNMLLATDATVSESKSPMDMAGPNVIAVYANDDGSAVSLCVCNVALANYIGAALSMLPPPAAQENAKKGTVPDNVFANLNEVFNICVNLTKCSDASRLSLRDVFGPADPIPEDVEAILSSPAVRFDVEVDVERYGIGSMALCALAESPVSSA